MSAPSPEASTAGRAPAELAVGLDTYTDAAAMRSLLQWQLPAFADGRLRIDALRVSKARRNTSRQRNPCPITLCYELQVSDVAGGRVGTQMLYAKVFRAGLAEPFFRQQDPSRLTPPAYGQALVCLPELNMVIWALPNDPGLPQLARLLNPAQRGTRVDLLRYEPECRATLRCTLAQASPDEEPVQYAKTFSDGRALDIHRHFEYFWRLAQTDPQAPLVARPLGHCAATQTVWQAPAPGLPLLHALAPHNAAALIGRVAQALALLHAAPLAPTAGAPPRSAAHWLAETRRRQQKISRVDAALAARAAGIADAIEAHAGPQAGRAPGLIHGDFHPDQIWVHDGRIVLFDFDEFALGDAMQDLATFVLKLEQAGSAPELGSVFIEQYAAAAPQRFDRRSLNWHLAVQSLVLASRAFTFQQPGWAVDVGRRLARSEAHAAALNKETNA